MDLHKAIRAIHNSVITINGDTQETIVAKDINENDIVINWTEVNAKATELEQEEATAKQAKEDLKASAKAKLIAGEPLTQEEADTIVL